MRQQVNLYQPIFRTQQKIFSSKTMLQGAAMVIVGLALFYVYALLQTQNFQRQLQQMEKQRNEDIQRIAELSKLYPEPKKDPSLEQKLQGLQKDLNDKKQVVEVLSDRSMGNREGFSPHLEGLARQRMPQIWLTQVSIRKGGEHLSLRGSSYQQEQVPQFIQRLNQETSYTGLEFAVFQMERFKEDQRQIDFRIQTLLEEKDA